MAEGKLAVSPVFEKGVPCQPKATRSGASPQVENKLDKSISGPGFAMLTFHETSIDLKKGFVSILARKGLDGREKTVAAEI
jgi:hypothetical protein